MRLFPELEDLLCYGCHAKESEYRSEDDKQIRICKSFAQKIWKADLDETSTRFDGCGLLAAENNFDDLDDDMGYINCYIKNPTADSELLMKSLVLGLEGIKDSYGEYVEIYYKEV